MNPGRPHGLRPLPGLVLALLAVATTALAGPEPPPPVETPGAQSPPANPAPPQPKLAPAPPAPAHQGGPAAETVAPFHIRSPYPGLTRTDQILNTLVLRALAGYEEQKPAPVPRAGVVLTRRFDHRLGKGVVRSFQFDVAPYPDKGLEIYLSGTERSPAGEGANPDQPGVEGALGELAATLDGERQVAQATAPDLKNLASEMISLSYVQTDHALGLLKALGYRTIEYTVGDGESVNDRVFSPTVLADAGLPVIVKLVDSNKTSLQDPAPGELQAQKVEALPELGGVYLHHVTAGDPQQRLLVVYDPADPASLARLLNLIRDQVDVPARQVIIEALVIEVQTTAARELGVNWEISGVSGLGRYKDTFDAQLGRAPVIDEANPRSPLNITLGRTGVADLFSFKNTITALVEKGKAQILSNPSALVLDGRQAKIQIGSKIPVKQTIVNNGVQTTSFEYFPVGIVLNMRPRVSDDGKDVAMQVETIVSSVRESIAGVQSENSAPQVDSRQVQTMVSVANDTPFIIGGLTSKDETDQLTGVPGLADLPLIGKLFAKTKKNSQSKEIIVVITPHVVPAKARDFTLVIPQQTPIFDSFGHQLFRNAYRVRDQDIFELDFLSESKAYRSLLECSHRFVAQQPAGFVAQEPLASLLRGEVPGEDVLVLKMIFELVRKTNFYTYVDPDKIFFFEGVATAGGGSGYKRRFLPEKLAQLDRVNNAMVMSFDARAEGTPDHPFWQPRAVVSYEGMTAADYDSRVASVNARAADGSPEKWSIVVTDAYSGRTHPLDILKGVIVLRRLLDLNSDLPLTLADFHAGRQLVFPTENDVHERFHLIDTETAKLYFEVSQYYPSFEMEFKRRGREILKAIGHCDGWDVADEVLLPGAGAATP